MTFSSNRSSVCRILRGGTFLSPDTRLECFLRGAKFFVKNLRGVKFSRKIIRGLKIFLSKKNKGCEMIRGMKFPNTRRNKGYEKIEVT